MNDIAEKMAERFNMKRHVENGWFSERHYESNEEGRPSSGAIYYYIEPSEKTAFHSIDCDEYWCYAAGGTAEIWLIGKDGTLSVKKLGITEDAEPLIYIEKGTVFASQSFDGTFVSCITVPRFSYDGFRQYTKEEIKDICPDAFAFWAE